MVGLWKELTPERTVSASDKAYMVDLYESNPRFAILNQPMIVAASNLARRRVETKATDLELELVKARSLVGLMGSRLDAFSNLSGAPVAQQQIMGAPPPRWEHADPAPPPAMTVAASAHQTVPAAAGSFRMPDILQDISKYNGSVGAMSLQDIRGAPSQRA